MKGTGRENGKKGDRKEAVKERTVVRGDEGIEGEGEEGRGKGRAEEHKKGKEI